MKNKKSIEELSQLINDHVANLQRIGVNWGGEIVTALLAVQRELLDYVAGKAATFGAVGVDKATDRKFEIIKRKIETLLNQAYSQAYATINKAAPELAENEAKWAGALTTNMTGSVVKKVTKSTVMDIVRFGRYNGATLRESFYHLAQVDADKIYTKVTSSIQSGDTPVKLRRAVQEVINTSNRNAQAIGLTCANGIANDAKLAFYSQNKDVVQQIEILNTLDGRTCPTCAVLGGQRFKVNDKGLPALPVHPRCRCVYIPVTELSDMGGTRPAANADFNAEAERNYHEKYPDKDWNALSDSTKKKYYHEAIHEYEKRTGKPAFRQVSGAMKFEDYFNSMSAQAKQDWLGAGRYALYQRNKLTLGDMINPRTNKFFTVSELKKRDIAGFKKVNNTPKKQSKKETHEEHIKRRKAQIAKAYDNRVKRWENKMTESGVSPEIQKELVRNYTPERAKLGHPPNVVIDPKIDGTGISVDNKTIYLKTNDPNQWNSCVATIRHEMGHWVHRSKMMRNPDFQKAINQAAIADYNRIKKMYKGRLDQLRDEYGLKNSFAKSLFDDNLGNLDINRQHSLIGVCDSLGSISNGRIGFGHSDYSGKSGSVCSNLFGTKNYYKIQNDYKLRNGNKNALPYGESVANIISGDTIIGRDKLKMAFPNLIAVLEKENMLL